MLRRPKAQFIIVDMPCTLPALSLPPPATCLTPPSPSGGSVRGTRGPVAELLLRDHLQHLGRQVLKLGTLHDLARLPVRQRVGHEDGVAAYRDVPGEGGGDMVDRETRQVGWWRGEESPGLTPRLARRWEGSGGGIGTGQWAGVVGVWSKWS